MSYLIVQVSPFSKERTIIDRTHSRVLAQEVADNYQHKAAERTAAINLNSSLCVQAATFFVIPEEQWDDTEDLPLKP